MQVKRPFIYFIIILLLNSSCATTNYNAPEVMQKGEGNFMLYKSPNAEVNKGTVYKGPVYDGPVTIYQEPSFWQNPWFWTAIAGIGATYYFSQREDPKPTPKDQPTQPTQGSIGIKW